MNYKEFLNSKDGYKLVMLPEHAGDDEKSGLIEVPESSDFATQVSDGDRLLFWRDEKLNIFNPDDREEGWYEGSSLGFDDYKKAWGATIVWQRCTQPEELPFIDDEPKKHSHYFKDVSDLNEIDVYQVLRLFNVTDPCLQHIVKKALCAGQRGHKDFETDLKNIFDTAKRALEINNVE